MRLFVGNFPWSTTEHDLSELFAEYGGIKSCRILTDRDTGRSRGFGFVEFEDRQDAEDAIANLHGVTWGGRPLRVSEAEAKTQRA